jgi:monofunctional biosynthetic peptidoglycan transglycosylase
MAGARTRKSRPKRAKRPFSFRRLVWNLFRLAVLIGVIIPLGLVVIYRFVPPPVTFLMAQRAVEGHGMTYRWRSIDKISPNMVNAAIGAEDARFCAHHGFDFEAIQNAMERNAEGGNLRGGSTISQQTAKNVFLWPQRSWVRKGLEAYFTGLIELIWGKRRIMEVYLNVAEMGPGIYGAEAAARAYWDQPASELTPFQASRIAAVLPSPLRYKAVNSGPYVQGRSRAIGGNAATVRNEGLSECAQVRR